MSDKGDSGTAATGHPLPASEEARHDEIPEGAENEKGVGDDAADPAMPTDLVDPAGKPYRSGA